MSNDAQRMVDTFQIVNNGLIAPFQIIGMSPPLPLFQLKMKDMREKERRERGRLI